MTQRNAAQADALRRQIARRAAGPVRKDPMEQEFETMLAQDMAARDWEAVEGDFLWYGRYLERSA